MSQNEIFERMVSLLRTDDESRKRLLEDPEGLLNDFDLSPEVLDSAHDSESLARAKELIVAAELSDSDTAVVSLRKLGAVAAGKYAVEVDAFGVTLLEKTMTSPNFGPTASATTKCSLNPWDGCKPDVDF